MQPTFDRRALPYWEARSQRWKVATPISPQADDVRFYEARAARNAGQGSPGLAALLLGVTPAIATMRWPAPTQLLALDWAEGMFRNVFPRRIESAHANALRGDWREMPIASASIDFVVGDGCYCTLADFEALAQVSAEVARVLRPGGEFCLRCHRRTDENTPVAALFERLLAGRIRDLDMFRWMLAMAVHGDSREGVCLGDVWRAWHERVPDARAAQARLGWGEHALANIEGWKGAATRYVFPSLPDLRELAAPHFDIEACDIPAYEWGELFPRLAMRRRAG